MDSGSCIASMSRFSAQLLSLAFERVDDTTEDEPLPAPSASRSKSGMGDECSVSILSAPEWYDDEEGDSGCCCCCWSPSSDSTALVASCTRKSCWKLALLSLIACSGCSG